MFDLDIINNFKSLARAAVELAKDRVPTTRDRLSEKILAELIRAELAVDSALVVGGDNGHCTEKMKHLSSLSYKYAEIFLRHGAATKCRCERESNV